MQGSHSVPDHTWRGLSTVCIAVRLTAESPRAPLLLPQRTVAHKETPHLLKRPTSAPFTMGSGTWLFLPTPSLSTAGHTAVLEEMEENLKRRGRAAKCNPSIDKTNTWTSFKSSVKSKQQTFQEQVKCDLKYSITRVKMLHFHGKPRTD